LAATFSTTLTGTLNSISNAIAGIAVAQYKLYAGMYGGCSGTPANNEPVALAVYFLGERHILAVYYITRRCDPEINA